MFGNGMGRGAVSRVEVESFALCPRVVMDNFPVSRDSKNGSVALLQSEHREPYLAYLILLGMVTSRLPARLSPI